MAKSWMKKMQPKVERDGVNIGTIKRVVRVPIISSQKSNIALYLACPSISSTMVAMLAVDSKRLLKHEIAAYLRHVAMTFGPYPTITSIGLVAMTTKIEAGIDIKIFPTIAKCRYLPARKWPSSFSRATALFT